MSSSVFFKFKSQKDPQRVTFDGTGISVFELKREIITSSRLGDGTDFDLAIYNQDTNEEYDDDTAIITRSTSVIARRLPASKPGQGRAARYVSGRMPVSAKNQHRIESAKPAAQGKNATGTNSSGAIAMQNAQTEEERIAAMFQAGGEQWEQQQQHMAGAKAIHRGGYKAKNVNLPDHEPPPGYICYRCGEKGHWIQVCPTNDDPHFDGRPRVKRTTGIPRSFLRTIEKPAALSNDGLTDTTKQPSGVMVNAEGEFVVAEPDKASWEQFQAKAKASAAQHEAAVTGSEELRSRGLECSIDKRIFADPMKTPCCGKTYCNDCIENALVNSDLVCPGCSTEGVLIDNLVPDEATNAKIKAYEEEQLAAKKEKEKGKSKSPTPVSAATATVEEDKSKASTSNAAIDGASTPTSQASTTTLAKKRPAEEEIQNTRIPTAPAAMRKQLPQQQPQAPNGVDQQFVQQMNAMAQGMAPNQPFVNGNMLPFQSMNSMGFMNGAGIMGMPMNMNMGPMMGMMPNMAIPMMMQQGRGAWPNMQGMGGGPPQQNGMYGQQNWQGDQGWVMNGMNGMNGMHGSTGMPQQQQNIQNMQMQNGKIGAFPNQQKNLFTTPVLGEEDSAYFRQPVNPHRHQARQRRARHADYKEL